MHEVVGDEVQVRLQKTEICGRKDGVMRAILGSMLAVAATVAMIRLMTQQSELSKDTCRITWRSQSRGFYGRGDWIVWNRAELAEWTRKQNAKDSVVKYGVECKAYANVPEPSL